MKKILILIVLICVALMSLTLPPVDKTKVPIKNVQGLQDSLAAKVNIATLESATDEFYNKTQSNARFINEDGDTITGTILVPTPAVGTNTTQVVNAEFLKTNGYGRLIYSNNVQHAHTGTTNETELFNFTIPANSMGANGTLQFNFKAQSTSGTTGIKYIRLKNGSSVLGYSFINSATTQINKSICTTENRNSTSAQISSNASLTMFNSAFTLTTIDTTQPWTVSVTAQLGVGTENVSIESLSVIAFYKD